MDEQYQAFKNQLVKCDDPGPSPKPAAMDFKDVAGFPVVAMVLHATSAMKSP